MHTYKLTVAYDGTEYSGWQIQPNGPSIQEAIEKILKTITRKDLKVTGSGRTDAGVHALGQVAHISSEDVLNVTKTLRSLNGLLPADIRIKTFEEVHETFHARYSATKKTYHYNLWTDDVADPFICRYRHHVRSTTFDIAKLKAAAVLLVGTHDFTSFACEASKGSAAKDPIRTIYRVAVVPQDGGLRVEFQGNGFLYKMVRNIMGTLLEIAQGKRPVDDITTIINAKDRRKAGHAAPAQGLFLVDVSY
ncbi:MAG: tRNA pseudouridine(38-40) synthase TruA [Waddliaceae bacterium]|jgi:tRNA pseudouridine38-40 synthase|nr:tRNA pseudouridine(38-40) synthase TruA [Waddliaceae bacterium]MBT3579662.1 tRNA pseudouridine(38-40) synthase TruA [Waddliaceae bacterium]MBT4445247.1 tRNA pseudouridine(38-40) synthase TruA [Waddliaceae bacterium]MBT6928093.1 tRNA pseudouridine(38-40) synthase TruA [Waddliaceae bacterium]MBT7264654.1 tRNA pseudouridine(38-40) synthase TruA [Waddliaceae bacterium]